MPYKQGSYPSILTLKSAALCSIAAMVTACGGSGDTAEENRLQTAQGVVSYDTVLVCP